MSQNWPPIRIVMVLIFVLCAGCSVSLHAGDNKTTAEQAYREALAKPFNDLTAAVSAANAACAGGSQPDARRCYIDTNTEIGSARTVVRTLRTVAVPLGFAKANADLMHGLNVFVEGLIKRNRGLAAHSDTEYTAGVNLVIKALALQRHALSEYPAEAKIVG